MLIIYDDLFLKHYTGNFHPENQYRLAAIMDALLNSSIKDNLTFAKPRAASIEQISLVHHPSYIKDVENYSRSKRLYYIDADTVVSENSYNCALLAAGACTAGIDYLETENKTFQGVNTADKKKFFFGLVRPPGHHAFAQRGSGFCIFNNISIAAKYAISEYGLKKIAIIDFDVHHGNGTQDIFYDDERVFYISVHQYPHYPGTGYWTEAGKEKGLGFNLNIPVTAFSGQGDYLSAFTELVFPLVKSYKPEMILVSAGFDAHEDDPLSSVNLEDETFYELMKIIISISDECENIENKRQNCNIGIILEGGYDHGATARSVLQVARACLEKIMPCQATSGKPVLRNNVTNKANLITFNNIKRLFKISDLSN